MSKRRTSAGDDASSTSSSPPPSETSDEPRSGSSEPWRTPAGISELASQINEVATRVLNGTIDVEQARLYASLTRNVAQLWSAQVTRARFLRQEPEVDFPPLGE